MDLESATKDVGDAGVDTGGQETRSKKAKSDGTERVPGKSVFPVARVQKILKADKELPMVAKEAVFIVSMATELFIERLALAAQIQASREKRATVQTKDLATVVRKEGEYFFLEEIMASLPVITSTVATKKRKAATTGEEDAEPSVTIMQAFAKVGKKDEERTEALRRTADEDERSTERDALEVQDNPSDEDIHEVEGDVAISPPVSSPADQSPTSTRPIDIDTDEEMENV